MEGTVSVTFFTIVRPFVGEFNALQRLAIASWLGAVPGAQVIVFGDREGAAEACEYLGAEHVPEIETTRRGVELVNDAFGLAGTLARHGWLCEVSADIVLGGDFLPALHAIEALPRPFVVGQRWDIDPGASKDSAVLHPPSGVDYFLYRRGTVDVAQIPAFAVGRTAYDNWLVWAAMERWGLQVIDATADITAVHVNHGHPEYGDKAAMLASEERAENLRLYRESGCSRWHGVTDAPWVLRGGRVRKRG